MSEPGADARDTIRLARADKEFSGPGGPIGVLDGIDFAIRAGEFFSIVGPSGCGKSTLLQIIAGLEQPTRGTVAVEGQAVRGPSPRASLMFQRDNLLEWRTLLDNVLLPAEISGTRDAAARDRARELIAQVGLSDFERYYPYQLSGGMRQRAALCRALAANRDILLMDEPFGALDSLSRVEHQMMLQDLWLRRRLTVVLVTHDIREAVLLSDRVAVMTPRPGRILRILDIGLARPRREEAEETPAFIELVARIRRDLAGVRAPAAAA